MAGCALEPETLGSLEMAALAPAEYTPGRTKISDSESMQ
jgi:hypothetical protein